MIGYRMKRSFFAFAVLCITALWSVAQDNPKREFRGAWLHVIGQTQWQNKTTEQAKAYIVDQLDKLQRAGCNAVIFQVRPTADAVYKSDLEPWSAWLTGKRGKAPDPMWDPMEYALQEAHKRGMEFHAWLNPYRVTSTAKEVLPKNHISNREPERFFRYNGQILFDPAYQQNRDFICEVVKDIMKRYDVDGIHIDDYFYPYPAPGKKIPDDASYLRLRNNMERNDWRRHNVDLLIEQLHKTIKETKPWVRFGISPFGIWRNKGNDPRGSESSGLQNYDDLYADILLWDRKGWVDYLVPQLYWNLDTQAAPSRKLVQWWNDNIHNSDLYIGQDVKRTMDVADPKNHDRNELDTKVKLTRKLKNVGGNVWWHGYWVTGNYKGAADSLAKKYQSTIALPPAYKGPGRGPKHIEKIELVKNDEGQFLEWPAAKNGREEKAEDVVRYVVYEFLQGEKQDLDNSQAIVALTPYNRVRIANPEPGLTYAVTALDRLNRESEPIFLYVK